MAKFKDITKLEIESVDGTVIDITESASIRGCFDPSEFVIDCVLPEGVEIPLPFVGHAEVTVSYGAGELERFFAKPKLTLKNLFRRFMYWITNQKKAGK